eukprot:COSAG05_NODE_273_length_12440_cov_22.182805_10_plen_124_part_00
MTATNPLFLELAVDSTFPLGEGLVSMSLVMCSNLVSVIFLAVPVDELGTKWQGWAVVVVTPFCALLMVCCFREIYRRLDADLAAATASTVHHHQDHQQQRQLQGDSEIVAVANINSLPNSRLS